MIIAMLLGIGRILAVNMAFSLRGLLRESEVR